MSSHSHKENLHTSSKLHEQHHSREENAPHHTLLFIKTLQFATLKHSNQRRKDPEKTPYINHPIGVANILATEAEILDIRVLQTALLHDTVEDTDTTLDEIEEHFGRDIRNFVDEVTDDQCLSYYERKNAQIHRATVISHEAKLVKLADKIYNLRDLLRVLPVGWTELRRQEYFVWAGKVIEGLLGTNKDLEEIVRELLARRDVVLPDRASPPPIPFSPPVQHEKGNCHWK